MAPINDPRPFAEVLHDWMDQHDYSNYRAAQLLDTSQPTIARWLDGRPCPAERSVRALMTLTDEGRAH